MEKNIYFIITAFSVLLTAGCSTFKRDVPEEAPARPEVLVARRVEQPLNMSGKLDDPAWERAVVHNLVSVGCGEPQEGGAAMLLWSRDFLYVGIKFYDSDIVQEAESDQEHFYRTGDLVEVFLKPENSPWYWEIYATPNNRKAVFWFAGPGRRLPSSFTDFAMDDLIVAAHDEGTLNDWSDKDEYWTAELGIPVKELEAHGDLFGPGSEWRILIGRYNYSIHLRHREISMVPRMSRANFHLIEEYGILRFEE